MTKDNLLANPTCLGICYREDQLDKIHIRAELEAHKTTKSSPRGSTVNVRVVGSPSDLSMPFALKDRRNVYFPDTGLPDSGSTLNGQFNPCTKVDGKLTYEMRNCIGVLFASSL